MGTLENLKTEYEKARDEVCIQLHDSIGMLVTSLERYQPSQETNFIKLIIEAYRMNSVWEDVKAPMPFSLARLESDASVFEGLVHIMDQRFSKTDDGSYQATDGFAQRELSELSRDIQKMRDRTNKFFNDHVREVDREGTTRQYKEQKEFIINSTHNKLRLVAEGNWQSEMVEISESGTTRHVETPSSLVLSEISDLVLKKHLNISPILVALRM